MLLFQVKLKNNMNECYEIYHSACVGKNLIPHQTQKIYYAKSLTLRKVQSWIALLELFTRTVDFLLLRQLFVLKIALYIKCSGSNAQCFYSNFFHFYTKQIISTYNIYKLFVKTSNKTTSRNVRKKVSVFTVHNILSFATSKKS